MRFQDHVVKQTLKALDDVCRAALAVPQEKQNWTPGGESRTVLSQMKEIAEAGKWFLPLVRDGKPPEFAEHAKKESDRLGQKVDTVIQCVDLARESTAALCNAILEMPDEVLEDEIFMPFGGGMTMTKADLAVMHAWNMTYHLGQINQIQLILGDRVMH